MARQVPASAEVTLAQAEFKLGDVTKAEAIMARLLKAQPDDPELLRVVGYGQIIAGQRVPEEKAARFKAARPFLGRAYVLEKNDFRILYAYAYSRSLEPGFPNDNDLSVLLLAHSLAPSVDNVTFLTGEGLVKTGRRKEAAQVLSVVANNQHGGEESQRAQRMIAEAAQPAAVADAVARAANRSAETPPKGAANTSN